VFGKARVMFESTAMSEYTQGFAVVKGRRAIKDKIRGVEWK
jgi:hypothetical protein